MAKDKKTDGSEPKKSSLAQTIGAAIAGMLAVKLATYIVATGWRLATKEDPPQADSGGVSMGKKAAWIALIGAATGAARQTARDLVKPANTADPDF